MSVDVICAALAIDNFSDGLIIVCTELVIQGRVLGSVLREFKEARWVVIVARVSEVVQLTSHCLLNE